MYHVSSLNGLDSSCACLPWYTMQANNESIVSIALLNPAQRHEFHTNYLVYSRVECTLLSSALIPTLFVWGNSPHDLDAA